MGPTWRTTFVGDWMSTRQAARQMAGIVHYPYYLWEEGVYEDETYVCHVSLLGDPELAAEAADEIDRLNMEIAGYQCDEGYERGYKHGSSATARIIADRSIAFIRELEEKVHADL